MFPWELFFLAVAYLSVGLFILAWLRAECEPDASWKYVVVVIAWPMLFALAWMRMI